MKLEDQICSLELSKRLKEFGVKQESLFVWEYYDDQCHGVKFIPYAVVPNEMNKFKLYSAFTVAELGELLGTYAESSKGDNGWYMRATSPIQRWKDMYPCKKEANARAKMLIYLLENKLMEVPT